ncbi:MAG TPA: spore germination lipoprotein GerD [Bacillota bacterium]
MFRIMMLSLISFFIFLTSGCGNNTEKEADYDATKKMVVDILQTEDGKKALAEIITDEKMKEELVIESDIVKKSIESAFTSDKGSELWGRLFKDPQFVKSYAESTKDYHKKLMKQLMDDPDYQKLMIDFVKDPELTEHIIQLLKSQQFNTHLEETIQKAMENPIFQAKIQEILLKAAEKQGQSQGKGQDSSGGEQGQQEQGGGGGDSGVGGGGEGQGS